MENKIKRTKNNKDEDRRFKKKNIKHDPQAESSRSVFSFPREEHLD